jgi:ERCC4-type nuclease
MVDIIIDSRETKLLNSIFDRDISDIKNNINIIKKQLDIGDINIKYNDIDLIFERKTVNDLLSSLKDGRLHEQKFRLLENYNPKNITYIIEGGDLLAKKNSQDINILTSIYYHTMFRDGIHVIFTDNIQDTTTFLLILSNKCYTNPDKFKEKNTYIDCIKTKTKKIDKIDYKMCYILQLCQIPTISKTIAQNISNIYPTFRELIKALDEKDNINNKIKLLCSINKIGKEKANKILEYLGYINNNVNDVNDVNNNVNDIDNIDNINNINDINDINYVNDDEN